MAPEIAPDHNPSAESSGGLILVVDDDFAARLQVKFTLENEGFMVVEAESGEEALAQFETYLPDLVLLDVVMPGIDGFATCKALREKPGGEHLPVIMVTALEDEQTITQAFEAGATDFISKPINMLVIGYRVRYWLRAGETVKALHKKQKQLVKAQDIARLGHWERDLATNAFQFSCPSPEIFGLHQGASYEMLFERIIDEEREVVHSMLDQACAEGQPFSINYRIVLEDGSERIILNQGNLSGAKQSKHQVMVGILQDITELKQAEDKIRYLAFYDNLTGLANRSLFREHWEKIAGHGKRNNEKIAVLFIDLDHFKRINDTLGHPAGDKVLITVAERLKTVLRSSDVVGRTTMEEGVSSLISRIGGDEFIVIAVDVESPAHAAKLAERILEMVCKPIALEQQDVRLTASIGISLCPEDGYDIDLLLKNADTAMYEAKQGGRDGYTFFQSNMNDAVRARFDLSNRIRTALEKKEFQLYYQPQFSNSTSRMLGVEALIRWFDPDNGIIPPDQFLPFAEESGFITSINRWVIEEACLQARQWLNEGLFSDCRMAVNISGNNLDFKSLFNHIVAVLEQTGLAPEYLEIELTERVMMDNTEDAREVLLKLKQMGVAIAIDDFGTGYSALSHLQLFPLTTLKIDKSFVQNIESSVNSLSLLNSIVGIAKSFDLNVVAEGVETENQWSALREMECDELQGFLLSKPLPRDEAAAMLKKGRHNRG